MTNQLAGSINELDQILLDMNQYNLNLKQHVDILF